ncbi:hypothetical protein NPIL_459621 [Nephila pilipes]|uniref:Uncharacterized protein n=1 Tax=Nephila pilipes TaxID=299642 RepID=A0A8X6MI02_NEPPI|nr:hypothetical protein NPIL_459621 [Nephila pilipes]
MELKAEKNKLKNLLNNNLSRKKELGDVFQEISVENRRRLEKINAEFAFTNNRANNVYIKIKDLEKKFERLNFEQKSTQKQLISSWKSKEREFQERINANARFRENK